MASDNRLTKDDLLALHQGEAALSYPAVPLQSVQAALGGQTEPDIPFETLEAYVEGRASAVDVEVIQGMEELDEGFAEIIRGLREAKAEVDMRRDQVFAPPQKTDLWTKVKQALAITPVRLSLEGAAALALAGLLTVFLVSRQGAAPAAIDPGGAPQGPVAVGGTTTGGEAAPPPDVVPTPEDPNAGTVAELKPQIEKLQQEKQALERQLQEAQRTIQAKDSLLAAAQKPQGAEELVQDGSGSVYAFGGKVVREVEADDPLALAINGQVSIDPELEAMQVGTRSGTPAFELRSPVLVSVPTLTPSFSWSAMSGAVAYEVEILFRGRRVDQSGRLSGLSWRPTRPLDRGETYYWQVTAYDAQGRASVVSSAGGYLAAFRTLSSSEDAELQRLRAEEAGRPLTLALGYARLGLLDEADAEMQKVLRDNPNSRSAQRIAQALADARRRLRG
jgi:hypothetical protein